jgi:hypothetical protein
MRPGENYSQVVDRLILASAPQPEPAPQLDTDAATLLDTLTAEREPIATVYRRLGWTRQQLEQVIITHRDTLAQAGMRLHVATHDAASGRRERYISVDGTRYSALSLSHHAERNAPVSQ